jgi:hypothetical protein
MLRKTGLRRSVLVLLLALGVFALAQSIEVAHPIEEGPHAFHLDPIGHCADKDSDCESDHDSHFCHHGIPIAPAGAAGQDFFETPSTDQSLSIAMAPLVRSTSSTLLRAPPAFGFHS